MRYKYVQAAVCLLAAGCAAAQTAAPDSMRVRQLTEVVVSVPKVIHKSDMDLYIPSKSAVEVSQNGFQLLGNLMIPALSGGRIRSIWSSISAATGCLP